MQISHAPTDAPAIGARVLVADDYRGVRVAATLDLRCDLCGYGIVSREPPGRCPMCGETAVWTEPLGRASRGAVGSRRLG
jgi:hypothetical protein